VPNFFQYGTWYQVPGIFILRRALPVYQQVGPTSSVPVDQQYSFSRPFLTPMTRDRTPPTCKICCVLCSLLPPEILGGKCEWNLTMTFDLRRARLKQRPEICVLFAIGNALCWLFMLYARVSNELVGVSSCSCNTPLANTLESFQAESSSRGSVRSDDGLDDYSTRKHFPQNKKSVLVIGGSDGSGTRSFVRTLLDLEIPIMYEVSILPDELPASYTISRSYR